MATSTAVPVEEYLRTSFDPDMEYVDGQIVERHVGEYSHSRLQSMIIITLGSRERERRFRVFTEQRVLTKQDPRYRVPDICVKRLPHIKTPVLTNPDLAIEIVSPDDSVPEMLEKVSEYLAAGIPHVWVVDPYKRTLVEADQDGVRRPASGILETELVGPVDFNQLFAALDEPAE
jgi:Uma2 family endonuclease